MGIGMHCKGMSVINDSVVFVIKPFLCKHKESCLRIMLFKYI